MYGFGITKVYAKGMFKSPKGMFKHPEEIIKYPIGHSNATM